MQTKKNHIENILIDDPNDFVLDANTVSVYNKGSATATLDFSDGGGSDELKEGEYRVYGGFDFSKGYQTVTVNFGVGTPELRVIKQTFIDL